MSPHIIATLGMPPELFCCPNTGKVKEYYLNDTTCIPRIELGHDNFDFIPCNKGENNNKIINMYIDYKSSTWKLVVEIYIDGRIYKEYVPVSDY